MFHAPMGRLELFIFITYFSTVVPFNVVFFPVGLSSLMRHFQQVLIHFVTNIKRSEKIWTGNRILNLLNPIQFQVIE